MYRTRHPRPLRYHSTQIRHPHHSRQYDQQQQQQQQATAAFVSNWLPSEPVRQPGVLTSSVVARRPADSFADLIYSLHQAASSTSQMGAHSSKDQRGPGAASPQQQTHSHHRHKKSSRSHHRGSGSSTPTEPTRQPSAQHHAQPISRHEALPVVPAATMTHSTTTRTTAVEQDDEIDNVNEAHNNFVVLTSSPGSAGHRQAQTSSLQRLVTPSSAAAAVAHGIKVVRLKVAIDKRLTVVDERSPAVLKYKTPHFRALATVEVPPLFAGQRIQIGWIQVCRDMTFVNSYGREGLTSWEFPEIVVGKYRMISDADGKQYPWYGSKSEVQTLEGPTMQPTHVTIHMNDNFFPQVTWYIPHSDYSRQPSLEFIYRKQRFYTFLALRDLNTNVYQILKTVAWMMELSIEVEPSNALGERARVLGPVEQERPYVLDESSAVRLEKYALNPPNANNSQVLVWRPRNGDPKVIVPPVQTTIDVSRYLAATRDQFSKLRHLLHGTTQYAAAKPSTSPR